MIFKGDQKYSIVKEICVFAVLSLAVNMFAVGCGVSVAVCLKFTAYQIAGIFLPGIAVSLLLSQGKEKSAISCFCLSYMLGYAVNVLDYFVIAAVGLSSAAARAVILAEFFISICVVFRKQKEFFLKNLNKDDTVPVVLFFVFLFVSFFSYSAYYSLPGHTANTVQYHADSLYWIENAAAMKISFPPAELRMSDTILYYHYFPSAFLAFASFVTDIDLFSLGYPLYTLGKSIILFGGLYELANEAFSKKNKQYIFLFILMFTTGLEKYSVVNYVAHILLMPFGFEIGYAFGAYFFAFMLRQIKSDAFDLRVSIACALSFLMCAGHKAPIALIYLLFAGIICLGWLNQKRIKKAFLSGIPLLACFIAVMVICIGFLRGVDNNLSAGSFSHVATLRATPLFDRYEAVALSRQPGIKGYMTTFITYFKLMFLFILSINPLLLFMEINGVIRIVLAKKAEVTDLALLSAILFGCFMGFFNAQEGVSQMYYTLSTYIPGCLFGLRHLEIPEKTKCSWQLAVVFILSALQCYWFFFNSGVLSCMKAGADNTFAEDVNEFEPYLPYSLQQSDYDALCWVRDNTQMDSLVVTDRSTGLDIDNYMFYGAFSERLMYLEGDRYFYNGYTELREKRKKNIAELYANSEEALEKVKNDGADYVIQTNWITPGYEGTGCSKVFSTDTINVWKIENDG